MIPGASLSEVCLRFSRHFITPPPNYEISARSEIPSEMYNVRLDLKESSAGSRGDVIATHCRSRRRRKERGRAKFISANISTETDGDDCFPLITTEMKC